MFFFAIETATSILIFGSVDNSRNNAHAPRHILHRASEPWYDLKILKKFQSRKCLFVRVVMLVYGSKNACKLSLLLCEKWGARLRITELRQLPLLYWTDNLYGFSIPRNKS